MVKIGNIELSVQELASFSDEQLKQVLKLGAKSGRKTTGQRKTSINDAPLEIKPSVEQVGDCLVFRHKLYKSGRKGGYPLTDLVTASEMIEAKEYSDENKITKTKFVKVNVGVIGENLVHWAKAEGFI